MKKLKYLFTICIPLITTLSSCAQQKETFDIVLFDAPQNWTTTKGEDYVAYTKENKSDGTYGRIIIYSSLPGTGNLDQDFETEWNELIVASYRPGEIIESSSSEYKEGWQAKLGVASFLHNEENNSVILITMVKKQTKISFVYVTNSVNYQSDFESFGSSIDFNEKLLESKNSQPNSQLTSNNSSNEASTQQLTQQNVYQFNISNFDDGWISTIYQDYVLVEKNKYSVYLNYSVPYNASKFSGTGLRDAEYYWDNYVTRQFTVKTKQFNDGGSMALKPPYMEGYATDKRTGKSCFIGMYLNILPNAANVIIGTAPDENAFRRLFPKANDPFGSDLAAMTVYNKFAVAAKDLTGKWQNGNTETAQWYYVSPSGYEGYAGMTVAATSATFQFNSNGTYSSIHNGATGAVGAMQTFQHEYKGKYSVTNWNITATNRYGGKTDQFDVYFVAVRGGRILKMNNHAGQDYSLVKVSLKNEASVSNTTTQQNSHLNAVDSKLIGKWNRSGAVHPTYADAASWGTAGYTTSRYEFKSDGTYLFTERSFRMTYPYILIVKENGTFTVNGQQLTLVPKKSSIQSYNKKNNLDELGSLVKTQNRTLEKVTYQYQFHYFAGIQEWNLVLQADKPTLRDGNFSSNDTFSNAWYFDQKYIDTDLTSPTGK